MMKRMEGFQYDDSLFTASARASYKSDLKDDDQPVQIAKTARKAAQPVLISENDKEAMSEEEQFLTKYDSESIEDIFHRTIVSSCLEKILGKDNDLELNYYFATSGYEGECGGNFMKPILRLEHAASCTYLRLSEPSVKSISVNLEPISDEDDVKADMNTVIRALAQVDPSWELFVTVTAIPHD